MSPTNSSVIHDRKNRQNDRVSTDRLVQLSNDNFKHQARMINISTTGIGILSNFEVKESENLQMSFELPFYDDFSTLKIEGTVKHCTPVRGQFLLGVAINSLSNHQTRVMEGFIKFKKNN